MLLELLCVIFLSVSSLQLSSLKKEKEYRSLPSNFSSYLNKLLASPQNSKEDIYFFSLLWTPSFYSSLELHGFGSFCFILLIIIIIKLNQACKYILTNPFNFISHMGEKPYPTLCLSNLLIVSISPNLCPLYLSSQVTYYSSLSCSTSGSLVESTQQSYFLLSYLSSCSRLFYLSFRDNTAMYLLALAPSLSFLISNNIYILKVMQKLLLSVCLSLLLCLSASVSVSLLCFKICLEMENK